MTASASSDHKIAEWQEARNIISGVDGRLAALRQYGMSFVAGLLAAQGLIEYQQASSTSGYVPTEVKFAILIASLLLIAAIYDVDRRELSIQRGAVDRAIQLEEELGFGLTGSIGKTYRRAHEFSLTHVLYLLFVGATTALGFAVLNPEKIVFSATTIAFLLAALLEAILLVAVMIVESRHHSRSDPEGPAAGT